jgi:hypothetical protein
MVDLRQITGLGISYCGGVCIGKHQVQKGWFD